MPAQSCEGTVDLFGQHGAGEFVREGHRRQREKQVGARLPLGWEAVMSADQEHEIAGLLLSLADELNETRRVEGAAGWIEEDLACGGMPIEKVKPLRNDLAHFADGVTADALQELGGDSIRVRVTRLADVIQEDLQTSSMES